MSHDVRYRRGDAAQNLILRRALWRAWGYRCYWCSQPRDLLEVQIDHMIPQDCSGSELKAMLDANLTPEARALGFDIDEPHNLGPICPRCNGEKRATNFLGAPRFMSLLVRARALEPAVVDTVRRFHNRNAMTEAIMIITGADPADTAVADTLSQLGPLLINRLRYIAPDILGGPSNYDFFDPGGDELNHVAVTLDEASRRARIVLEDAYGCDFDAAILEAVRALIAEIQDHLSQRIASPLWDRGYDPDVGDVVGRIDINVTRLTLEAAGPSFEFQGSYEAEGSALVAIQNSRNDSGTSWVDRYSDDEGQFSISFFPGDVPAIEVDYVELEPAVIRK